MQPNKGVLSMRRYLALIGILFLGACQTTDVGGGGYVRARGRTNPQQLQLMLAQCQGEAAASPQAVYIDSPPIRGGWVLGLAGNAMARAAQVDAQTSACMARNGYVVAQPKPQQP
jgi:hypothetical protein